MAKDAKKGRNTTTDRHMTAKRIRLCHADNFQDIISNVRHIQSFVAHMNGVSQLGMAYLKVPWHVDSHPQAYCCIPCLGCNAVLRT